MTTITLTETRAPSRSKGRGWLRVDGINSSFATPKGRTIEVEAGTIISLVTGTEIRRATRTEKERKTYSVVVTGDAADTVETTISSPQSYDATICGVRIVEA